MNAKLRWHCICVWSSLAVSDMCIVLPVVIHYTLRLLRLYISSDCYIVALYRYFYPSFTLVSLLNILALGVDHFIAIVKPLHYNRIVSNVRTKVCIVLIWLISFITVATESIPDIINFSVNKETEDPFCTHMSFLYMLNPKIPYFLVTPELIVLIILYTRVYVAYKKFVTRRHSFLPDEQHNNKAIHQDNKSV